MNKYESIKYKFFLIKLAAFLAPVIFFLLITEIFLRNYSTSYDQKRAYLEKSMDEIEVLILGNSQALSGFDPSRLSFNAFNFAHDSQSLDYDIMMTEKYLPSLPRLKIIVIPISYFSLYYQLSHSSQSHREYNYFFSYNLPIISKKPLDIHKYSYIAAYTPRIAFGLVYLGKFNSRQRQDGFSPRQGVLEEKDGYQQAAELVNKHKDVIRKENYLANVDLLEHFLQRMKGKKIRVVLASIPVSGVYRQLQQEEVLKKNFQTLDNFRKKFNVCFVDLQSLPLGNEYFSDIDHLNTKGAALVSSRLDSVICNQLSTSY